MKKEIMMTLLATAALVSCDDGLIYPHSTSTTEGKVVKLTGKLSGRENWPDTYQLALAGFESADAEYASVAKTLPEDLAADGKVEMVLSGIQDNVTEVRLCVLDRLNRHIATFQKASVRTATDTVRMEVSTMDVSPLQAIQLNVFSTTCANCHGGSGRAAAGLDLTAGNSEQALVGQSSSKVDGAQRVSPGNATGSVLHQVLNTGLTNDWRYTHTSEVTSTDMLKLIDDWINSLND